MSDVMFTIFIVSQIVVPFLIIIAIALGIKLYQRLDTSVYLIESINDTTFRIQDDSITNSTATLQKVISETVRMTLNAKRKEMKPVGFNTIKSSEDVRV